MCKSLAFSENGSNYFPVYHAVVISCAGPVATVDKRKCQHLWPIVVRIWRDGQDAIWRYWSH